MEDTHALRQSYKQMPNTIINERLGLSKSDVLCSLQTNHNIFIAIVIYLQTSNLQLNSVQIGKKSIKTTFGTFVNFRVVVKKRPKKTHLFFFEKKHLKKTIKPTLYFFL